MKIPERKYILAAIVALIMLAGSAIMLSSNTVSSYETGGIPLGILDCEVTLGITAMKDGAPTNCPILNNPLYAEGVEIDSLQFSVSASIRGSNINLETLSGTAILSVNDVHLKSWDWTGDSFSSGNVQEAIVANELQVFLSSSPDRIDSEGIGYYYVNAKCDCYVSVSDDIGNIVGDSVSVRNNWELSDALEATSVPLVSPEFTISPDKTSVDYGDSIQLSWTATDDNPLNFKITAYTLEEGSQILTTGSWQSLQPIVYDFNALYSSLTGEDDSVGVLVTCVVYDDDEQSAFSSVEITVRLPSTPTTDPIEFLGGSITPSGVLAPNQYEFVLNYKPRCTGTPDSWKLLVNDVQVRSGSWDGNDINVVLLYQVDAGKTYNFVCLVSDADSNSESYTLTVKATTSTEPASGIGDPTNPNLFYNLPFLIPGIGEGGTLTVIIILLSVPFIIIYKRWRAY
jgi:hypothetical protein